MFFVEIKRAQNIWGQRYQVVQQLLKHTCASRPGDLKELAI